MRITSVVVAFVAGLTLAMTGCGGVEPEQSPGTDPAVEQGAPDDVTAQAVCPLKWLCDTTGKYYSTQSTCASACDVTCYRDYACTGTCICP